MGLRSPQQMETVKTRQDGSTRFSGAVVPKISTEFIDTLSTDLTRDENLRIENKKKADALVIAKASNEAEVDTITAMSKATQSEGLNASKAGMTSKEELKRALDKRLQGYASEYHPYIQAEFDKKVARFDKAVIPHVYGQTKKAEDGIFKTQIANKANEAVEGGADPQEFQVKLKEVQDSVIEHAKRSGLSPLEAAHNVEATVSKTVVNTVKQQATMGRPDIAARTLQGNLDKMTEEDKVKAVKLLDSIKTNMGNNLASSLAEKAMSMHPDDIEAQQKYLAENSGGDDRVLKLSQMFHGRNLKVKKDAEELMDAKAVSALFKAADGNGPIDPSLINNIKDPIKRDKVVNILSKNGGMANRLTDKPVYRGLVSKSFNDREAFKKEDLEKYQLNLSPSDYKFLVDKQTSLKDGDIKRQDKIDYSTDKMVQDLARDQVKSAIDAGLITDEQKTEMYISMMDLQERLLKQGKGLKEIDIRRAFAERVQKFKTVEEENPTWYNLNGFLPFNDKKNGVNNYIPTFDHSEDEIKKIMDKRPDWETEKVLKFLDLKKSKK